MGASGGFIVVFRDSTLRCEICELLVRISMQRLGMADGVCAGWHYMLASIMWTLCGHYVDIGADVWVSRLGYAGGETEDYSMPLTHSMATKLDKSFPVACRFLIEVRPWCCARSSDPDGHNYNDHDHHDHTTTTTTT